MPSKLMTADGDITTATTGQIRIKAIIAHGQAVTEGDLVAIRSGGVTGTVMALAVSNGSNGQFGQTYPEPGLTVLNPAYYTEQKASGTIRTEIVYE